MNIQKLGIVFIVIMFLLGIFLMGSGELARMLRSVSHREEEPQKAKVLLLSGDLIHVKTVNGLTLNNVNSKLFLAFPGLFSDTFPIMFQVLDGALAGCTISSSISVWSFNDITTLRVEAIRGKKLDCRNGDYKLQGFIADMDRIAGLKASPRKKQTDLITIDAGREAYFVVTERVMIDDWTTRNEYSDRW